VSIIISQDAYLVLMSFV